MSASDVSRAPVSALAFACCVSLCSTFAHADLLFHQGFESCWTPSDAPAAFLARLHDSVDGLESCIPPMSGNASGVEYSICDAPACAGGASGCPVLLHAGAADGDFASGAFTLPGSGDDVAIPVSYTIIGQHGSCTLTVSDIALDAALDYAMLADGADGAYTDALMQVDVTIGDYALSGCDALSPLIGAVAPTLIADAEDQAAAAILPVLSEDTVGISICPLSP